MSQNQNTQICLFYFTGKDYFPLTLLGDDDGQVKSFLTCFVQIDHVSPNLHYNPVWPYVGLLKYMFVV